MNIIARAIPKSRNSKIGVAAATYASQGSCPGACPLRGSGCYAETGRAGITTNRLNAADDGASPEQIAEAEALEIDALETTNDLRVHVVGDCATPAAAEIVSSAADRFSKRGGGIAWTYTHAWRDVPRSAWGGVSVLASVENLEDAARARARGYAVAMVVPDHPTDGRAETLDDGRKLVPCAEQTRGRTCVDCRLCLGDTALRDRDVIITFAVHGSSKARALVAIEGV